MNCLANVSTVYEPEGWFINYIRPQKVMTALLWWKENNPHYSNVEIDHAWLEKGLKNNNVCVALVDKLIRIPFRLIKLLIHKQNCSFLLLMSLKFLFQVVKMLVVVLVTFVVTWLPNMIFLLVRYHLIGKFHELNVLKCSHGGCWVQIGATVQAGLRVIFSKKLNLSIAGRA